MINFFFYFDYEIRSNQGGVGPARFARRPYRLQSGQISGEWGRRASRAGHTASVLTGLMINFFYFDYAIRSNQGGVGPARFARRPYRLCFDTIDDKLFFLL